MLLFASCCVCSCVWEEAFKAISKIAYPTFNLAVTAANGTGVCVCLLCTVIQDPFLQEHLPHSHSVSSTVNT